MNVCVFTRITDQHRIKGGMELHCKVISEGLIKRNHNVTIITTAHPDGVEYEEKEGVKIHYLKNTMSGLYTKQFGQLSIKRFEELQHTEKFNVIWSQSAGGYYYIRKLKSKHQIPIVTILHGTSLGQLKSNFIISSSFRNWIGLITKRLPWYIFYYFWWGFPLLHNSDSIIAVSKEIERAVQKEYFVQAKKIYTIYNGVDLSLFSPSRKNGRSIRKKYGINENDQVLLLLGKTEKAKGMHLSIQAMPKVLQVFPNVKLLIVGKGPYLKTLETLADKLDVLQNVIFCGFVPNKETPSYYNACDIYLNPTLLIEACPFVTIEALATGKPVIASRIGAIKSIINDGETGFLIKPGDFRDLAKKTIQLLKDESLIKEMSKKAREKALREFNQENMIENTIKVILKVIREKNKR